MLYKIWGGVRAFGDSWCMDMYLQLGRGCLECVSLDWIQRNWAVGTAAGNDPLQKCARHSTLCYEDSRGWDGDFACRSIINASVVDGPHFRLLADAAPQQTDTKYTHIKEEAEERENCADSGGGGRLVDFVPPID
jgi:hypothetical protein